MDGDTCVDTGSLEIWERVFEHGVVLAGTAAREIQRHHLYKPHYASFPTYYTHEFGLTEEVMRGILGLAAMFTISLDDLPDVETDEEGIDAP